MSTIINLPQVGESVTEGVIGKWLKQPGDHVDKFEPLVEVMTDKVNMETPSPVTGTLLRTLVAEGDIVPMGEPIAEVEEDEPSEHFEFVGSVRSVGPTGSGEGGEGRPDVVAAAAVRQEEEAEPGSGGRAPDERPPLSPLVRRLAAEHGIDPAQVRGSGKGGRVTRDDVLRHLEQRAAPPAASLAGDATSVRALTPLRKSIAEHLSRSAREAPAAWSMVEVDVSGMVRLRAAHREAFERSTGVRLTYLPFCAHAVAQELSEDPLLNGRWDGDHVTLNHRVRLGVAVSTEQGLVVPVVHDADRLSVEGLAVRMAELAKAARDGALALADVQGGTFTLDNTGALGSIASVPIINHPQAAVLTTEAIVKRPVVTRDDAIAIRSMMNVCMTFDHRVCDGAEAARFLGAVKARLEAMDEGTPLY